MQKKATKALFSGLERAANDLEVQLKNLVKSGSVSFRDEFMQCRSLREESQGVLGGERMSINRDDFRRIIDKFNILTNEHDFHELVSRLDPL